MTFTPTRIQTNRRALDDDSDILTLTYLVPDGPTLRAMDIVPTGEGYTQAAVDRLIHQHDLWKRGIIDRRWE